MGWSDKLESFFVQKNGFIEITSLTCSLESADQATSKVAERHVLIGMG